MSSAPTCFGFSGILGSYLYIASRVMLLPRPTGILAERPARYHRFTQASAMLRLVVLGFHCSLGCGTPLWLPALYATELSRPNLSWLVWYSRNHVGTYTGFVLCFVVLGFHCRPGCGTALWLPAPYATDLWWPNLSCTSVTMLGARCAITVVIGFRSEDSSRYT